MVSRTAEYLPPSEGSCGVENEALHKGLSEDVPLVIEKSQLFYYWFVDHSL